MMAAAVLKPRDLAVTTAGRPCRILEILPEHRRRISYTDCAGGEDVVRTSDLTLVRSAMVRPWKERVL